MIRYFPMLTALLLQVIMYGTPSSYYQASTTAPEWQQSQPAPVGPPWQTQAPGNNNNMPSAPPPPPRPPPLPPRPSSQSGGGSYQPAVYGAMPAPHGSSPSFAPSTPTGAQQPGGFDTMHWGVKYNQQQFQQPQQYEQQQQPHFQGQTFPTAPPALPVSSTAIRYMWFILYIYYIC